MKWTQVRIPTELFTEMTQVIEDNPEKGYINEHEFIRDAIRDKIDEVKEPTKKEACSV